MAALASIRNSLFASFLAFMGIPASGLVMTNPAIAATLAFESDLTDVEPSQTWLSPFKGPVTLSLELDEVLNDLDFTVTVQVDGETKLTETIQGKSTDFEDSKAIASLALESIDKNTEIEFEAVAANGQSFDIKALVAVEEPSLVFIEPKGDSIGQVALFYEGNIYESHPDYKADPYENIFKGVVESIEDDYGVQKTHSLGSFLGLAEADEDRLLPWDEAELVPIPKEEAELMATWIDPDAFYDPDNSKHQELFRRSFFLEADPEKTIEDRKAEAEERLELLNVWIAPDDFFDPDNSQHQTIVNLPINPFSQLNRGYISTFVQDFTTPLQQKGIDGGRYSEVGLIERAAEIAGIDGGQGYIPNSLEFIAVNKVVQSQSGFGCTVVGCNAPINQTQYLSVLSPGLLYERRVNGFDLDDWLQGRLEEVDFILTAPDGKFLSFQDGEVDESSTLGEDEIKLWSGTYGADAGVGNSGGKSCPNSPDVDNPLPKENLQFVQFLIEDRQPGQYKIQLTGKSSLSRAILGNDQDGIVVGVGDCFKPNPIVIPGPVDPESVPEPTTVLGLLAVGGAGVLSLRRRSHIVID